MTILFFLLLLVVVGRLFGFALRASWGIFKIFLYIIFLPLILVGMVLSGFVYLALPILLIVGLVGLLTHA